MAEFLCVFCGAFYVNSCYLDYRLSLSARSSFRVKTELRNVVFFLLKVVLEDVGYRVTVMVLGMDTVDLTDVAHVGFRLVVHEQGSLVRFQVRRHEFAQGMQRQRTKNVVTHGD